jgi:mRNA-degrading endonuclease RelE of RelBE toxin-antitoxin system
MGYIVDFFNDVEDWIGGLDDKRNQAVILHVLETFKLHGSINSQLPRTRLKHLFDGVWEIRAGQYRLAYFWDNQHCLVLHGIVKKRDDWPHKDVKLVKQRKAEYQSKSMRKEAKREGK